jgi:HSP20 family protein
MEGRYALKQPISDYLDFILARANEPGSRGPWRPAADVYRCEHGWLVKLDLAGVQQQDIQIRVAGSAVIISGTRRDWRLDPRQQPHLMEISYSQFERRVELPEEFREVQVQSEYRDGMLLVRVFGK